MRGHRDRQSLPQQWPGKDQAHLLVMQVDLLQGKKWLVLGLVWQLIKMYLFKQISITTVPGLINLILEGEDIEDLMKLSPEQLLVRWVNHQLVKVRPWSYNPLLQYLLYMSN